MHPVAMKLILMMVSVLVAMSPALAAPASIDTLANGDVMKDSGFKSAYLQALGPLKREAWLIEMDGPGTQRVETVAGARYLLVTTCKNHDCGDNNMVVIYATAPRAIYGEVWHGRRMTAIGDPPPAIAAELVKIWKTEWPGH